MQPEAAGEADEQLSQASMFDALDVGDVVRDAPSEPVGEEDDGDVHPEPGILEQELDCDLWEDTQGVAKLSDEEFDATLSQMTFSGANKVLRFVVPIKSRQGLQILAGLQEIVTECHRLGYPGKVAACCVRSWCREVASSHAACVRRASPPEAAAAQQPAQVWPEGDLQVQTSYR